MGSDGKRGRGGEGRGEERRGGKKERKKERKKFTCSSSSSSVGRLYSSQSVTGDKTDRQDIDSSNSVSKERGREREKKKVLIVWVDR